MDETANAGGGELAPRQGAEWNPVERLILERRSVRKYKDGQVPEHAVRRILEAGRFAPSAGNCQPWKVVVIRDKAVIDDMERHIVRLCKLVKFFIDWRTSPLGRKIPWIFSQVAVRLMPNKLHPIPFGAICLIADGKLSVFHGAPTVLLLLTDKRGVGSPLVDLGCCGQNMVLAAHSMGLGTCWVGFVEFLKFGTKWKRKFGVGWPYEICQGITIGYPYGRPDGMIAREEMLVDWYENGERRPLM
jgi:nitroreductase